MIFAGKAQGKHSHSNSMCDDLKEERALLEQMQQDDVPLQMGKYMEKL